MTELGSELLHESITFPCPRCGFYLEIHMIDAITRACRWCPCCRAQIEVIDVTGSVSVAIGSVDAEMAKLEKQLRRLFH